MLQAVTNTFLDDEEDNSVNAENTREEMTPQLLQWLQVKPYPLEVAEIVWSLLKDFLSPEQVVCAFECFMRSAFGPPGDRHHYHIPSKRFVQRCRLLLRHVVKYTSIDTAQRCDYMYLVDDETSKDRVSIHGVGARMVKKLKGGQTIVKDTVLDMAILENQTAASEFKATIAAMECEYVAGEGVMKVPVCKVVGKMTDNASTAQSTTDMFEAYKKEAYEEFKKNEGDAVAEKEDDEKWNTFFKLKCSNHQLALISSAFVGGLHNVPTATKLSDSKIAKASGKVENTTQALLIQKYNAQVLIRNFFIRNFCRGYSLTKAEVFSEDEDMITTGWVWRRWHGVGAKVLLSLSVCLLCADNKRQLIVADEAPNVSATVFALSKLFGSGGEHGKYYLNESSELKEYVSQKFDLVTLPSFKGSRMHWILEVCVGIVMSYSGQLCYLGSTRIPEQSPNKLILAAWKGLSDVLTFSAIIARAYVFVALIEPARFALGALAGRWDVHRIFACIQESIEAFTSTDDEAFETFGLSLCFRCPDLYERMKSYLELQNISKARIVIMKIANDAEFKPYVSEYLKAGMDPMLQTLRRNLDPDHHGIAYLREAFVVSDHIESLFGVLDHAMTRVPGATASAMRGPAMAKKSGCMDSMRQLIKADNRRLRKYNLPLSTRADWCDEKFQFGSYYSIDISTRRKLYHALRRKLPDISKTSSDDLREQRLQSFRRKQQRVIDKEIKDKAKLQKSAEFLAATDPERVLYRDLQSFRSICFSRNNEYINENPNHTELKSRPTYSVAGQVEMIRHQINFRKYVFGYNLPKGALLSNLNDQNVTKRDQLMKLLTSLFKSEEVRPLPVISTVQIREERVLPAGATFKRRKLDSDRSDCTARLTAEFFQTFEFGAFSAVPRWRPASVRRRGTSGLSTTKSNENTKQALVGCTVGRHFSEGYFTGVIVEYVSIRGSHQLQPDGTVHFVPFEEGDDTDRRRPYVVRFTDGEVSDFTGRSIAAMRCLYLADGRGEEKRQAQKNVNQTGQGTLESSVADALISLSSAAPQVRSRQQWLHVIAQPKMQRELAATISSLHFEGQGSMEGSFFRVFDIYYHEGVECVVCAYYDRDIIEDGLGFTHADMQALIEKHQPNHYDGQEFIEVARYQDVMNWANR